MYIKEGFESFLIYVFDKGSVGQRAAKLPSVKLCEWFGSGGFEPVPHGLAHTSAVMVKAADLFLDLWLWQLLTLQSFDLKTPDYIYVRI